MEQSPGDRGTSNPSCVWLAGVNVEEERGRESQLGPCQSMSMIVVRRNTESNHVYLMLQVKNTGLLISASDYPIAEECRPNTRPLADTANDHPPALHIEFGGPC